VFTPKASLDVPTPIKIDYFPSSLTADTVDIWKSPSVGTPANGRFADRSPSMGTPASFSGRLVDGSPSVGAPTSFIDRLSSSSQSKVPSSKLTPVPITPTHPLPKTESLYPNESDFDRFLNNTDELDTLSFLGLGSPASAKHIPASAVKYSSQKESANQTKSALSSHNLHQPPGLEQVDPLQQYRESLRQYRNESKLFSKLSTHQRDMVMPLWEDYLPIFPTSRSAQSRKTWSPDEGNMNK
jgi:hypothetical protein